jgi:hypothetical protein
MRQILILLFVVVLSGCATRSISNSGYDTGGYQNKNENPFYQGELSEFDVLGIEASNEITEEEIEQAFLASKDKLRIRKGDPLLVIQSGAIIPDQQMIDNLEKYFSVSIFSGIPEKDKDNSVSYSKSLRLSAAKAGIGKIMVYWGVLESGKENLATKTISWVPIVGWGLPDESQKMRIRLKVALINARTGQWEIFSPKAFDDSRSSSYVSRESSDQTQVEKLKSMSYEGAVESLLQRYSN